jgi:hypothetical protein
MTEGVTVLGIRHHGPGSARSVLRTLQRIEPDLVLVEGPPDAQRVLQYANAAGMRPPVALVVYPPDKPGVGAFYPFASFSPEWNAIRYALARQIPVRFCDLPQANMLADATSHDTQGDEPTDPIALLAHAAGEPDPERWWERMVEQRGDDEDVFHAVNEAMAAVRETVPPPVTSEARREAHMRQMIRKGLAEGFSRVAVVCGAWHAPALETLPTRKADETLLRGLKKIKVDATWVPWTASRLAYTSGYGAGVESPAWYRHLWETNGDLTAWLTSAARVLRGEDLDASPAQVVDAVRLAETLAALRERPQPSLSEVTDATLSVLCSGEAARMQLIRDKLIVGEEMGALPPEVPAIPLQRDIEAHARRLRLRMEPGTRVLDLDLRVPHQLEQSRFLHRLRLLGIDWGRLDFVPTGRLGTFHEFWSVRWKPEMILGIIESGVYGNTLVEAATARAVQRSETTTDLGQLANLLDIVLLADLEGAIPSLVTSLGNRSATSTDVSQMLRALPPLAATLRYGDVRHTDVSQLKVVVRAIAERASVGLAPASVGLDADAAQTLSREIVAATQSLGVHSDSNDRLMLDDWWTALRSLVDRPDAAHLIAGACTRLLLNAEHIAADDAERRMARALARGTQALDAAQWIEGFLSPEFGGSGMMLATSARLFGMLDDWLTGVPDAYFAEILPLLRRTTSSFTPMERRQIAERVSRGDTSSLVPGGDELDLDRAAQVEPILKLLLGLDG